MNRYKKISDGTIWHEISRKRQLNDNVVLRAEDGSQERTVSGVALFVDYVPVTAEPPSVIEDGHDNLSYGGALRAAKHGHRITRRGKGDAWLCLMPSAIIPADLVNGRTLEFVTREELQRNGGLRVGGYFVLWNNGVWQPGWVPSQDDMLAEDWIVLDGKHGDHRRSDESMLPRSAKTPETIAPQEPMGRPPEME